MVKTSRIIFTHCHAQSYIQGHNWLRFNQEIGQKYASEDPLSQGGTGLRWFRTAKTQAQWKYCLHASKITARRVRPDVQTQVNEVAGPAPHTYSNSVLLGPHFLQHIGFDDF